MGMRAREGGWGYAINYEKEIANDLALIADLENCVARGWVTPEGCEWISLQRAALDGGSWLERLGLTEDDRRCIAEYCEISDLECQCLGISLAGLPDDWYWRAETILKGMDAATEWSGGLLALPEIKKARARAMASLSRHRRNARKPDASKRVRL